MRCLSKFCISLLLVSLLIVFASIYTYAASSLNITAAQAEYGPKEKVEITVQELDENQQPVAAASTIKVKISRGGVTDQTILKDGITLTNGAGKFTFITPAKPGSADILVIDPTNNLSAKLSLQINEVSLPNDWKPEFATISKIKGKVAVRYSGKNAWDSALTDSKLHELDTIMTWDKSWATLQLFDGSELTLQPCTTLFIRSLKSSANTPVKQSVFKLLTGRVLAKAKQYLDKGSKFEIESESATAGVKGTFFEFGSSVEGAYELIVYEGTVFMDQLQDEMLYAIQAGQKFLSSTGLTNPEIGSHSITPDQRDKTLADDEAAAGPDQDNTADNGQQTGDNSGDNSGDQGNQTPPDNTPKPGPKPNTNLLLGSQMIGTNMYFTLHFQPEFKKIFGTPIGLGLNLTLYQDKDGKVQIAGPNAETIDNFINWIEYDGKNLYLRYGALTNISYDPGLLFNGYTCIKDPGEQSSALGDNSTVIAKGFQFGLKNIPIKNLGFKVLIPYDVKSFSPWVTEPSSSLFAGRLYYDTKLLGLPLEFGGNYVTDTNKDLNNLTFDVPTSGFAVDCMMPLSSLATPYVEGASLTGFGSGAEAGIKGSLFSLVQYRAGLRMVTAKFVPNYFGNNYEIVKYISLAKPATPELPNLNDELQFGASTGYYFNTSFSLGKWANLYIGYENYDNMSGYAPLLSGNLNINTPALFSLPSISGGFTYQQSQFKDFKSLLNDKTNFSWYVKYPINQGINVTLVATYDPSINDYTKSMTMSMGM